ncbi:DUF481 domain-containing protein [Salinisphaera sp. P385]|uniref:DUF481 domain-containing protein n=1 Tax=Spectribacter acetivorans TaxID=3075603 RepID=A0ABU3BA80_9GAMM|nr:DUF481 domain-containing protein [Salinisphaera sp. P385]MDT0619377.1 DUF481 domain-containing protein [Salinisphaera sp. P385]
MFIMIKALQNALALILVLAPTTLLADAVYLADESVIKGEIISLDGEALEIETSFAGTLTVERDAIDGLATDEPMVITTEEGDEVEGRLAFVPGEGQRIADSAFGTTTFELSRLSALRGAGEPSPAEVRLAELRERRANLWSGQLLVGLGGTSGNSESRSLNFGARAKREAEDDRLFLNLLVNKAQQDGVESADEKIGTVRLERDFSERFFVFAQTEAERDDFENIDFRSTTTLGPGYFFLERPGHQLKGRMGLGYEYIARNTGQDESEAVLTLGYDYLLDVSDWFQFTHNLTVIPQVSDSPADNFRVDSTLALEAPLGGSSLWSLAAQYRHQYNNNPEPGVEDLDATYLLNLARTFE